MSKIGERKPPELTLLVGAARSGTTLTRLLLDAHPEIGCPSEAGIPALLSHLARAWSMVNADDTAHAEQRDPGGGGGEGDAPARWDETDAGASEPEADSTDGLRLPKGGQDWAVTTVQQAMGEYCERTAKRIYCDKSLDSVHHLRLVHELFPQTRVVLLFRHVMDTVASGVEASPWGFQAYGYAPYVQALPGNSVAALASYWLDHVTAALSWEKVHPETCHRVRYEDLVAAPERIVAEIQRFLGVAEDLSVLRTAFERPPSGPGDYKVEHTSRVHAASIGHGKRVPVSMLPIPLLKALNEQLEDLGYPPLDNGWNMAERPIDGRGLGLWASRLAERMSSARVEEGWTDLGSFAVIAEDHHALRWVIDPSAETIEHGDGDVEAVLTGTAEDLGLALSGEENLGVLVRSGRLRYVVPGDQQADRQDMMRQLNAMVTLLRRSVDRPRDSCIPIQHQ